MNSRPVRLIVGGLVAIAITALAAWFVDNFERVESSVYVGYSGEARYNPFPAAERLLIEMGIEADDVSGIAIPQDLPSASDTLILGNGDQSYTADQTDELLQWASDGGHLVYTAPGDGSGLASPMLDALGLSTTSGSPDAERDEDTDVSRVDPLGDDSVMNLCFHTASRLVANEPDEWEILVDDDGIVMATTRYGDGDVTVLASSELLTTDHIGYYDNADFAVELVTDRGSPGAVWYFHHLAVAPLWKLTWQAAWPAIVGAALLIGAFLYARGRRFGPLIPAPPGTRRSLDEHVEACGNFLYRSDGSEALLGAARDLVARDLVRLHHSAGHADADTVAALIGRHTGKDPVAVKKTLNSPSPQNHREFADQIGELQRLWKSL